MYAIRSYYETGRHPLIALSTTKDVQDAILADPMRSKIVDIIDIRYWSSRADGSVYAPVGGANLAPRQFARLENKGPQSVPQVYNDVLTYKKAFPAKAVMYSFDQSDKLAWAIFMAGGSLAGIVITSYSIHYTKLYDCSRIIQQR